MHAGAKSRLRGRLGALAVAALVVLAFYPLERARADDRSHGAEACFEAAEAAQPLLRARKLRAARQKLEACSREECPRVARADCRMWLAELTRQLPSIVLFAREEDASGTPRPLREVRVSIDGELVATRLDGEPVSVDPGAHIVRFERTANEAVEQRIELREGESARAVDVVFGPTAPRAPASLGKPAPAAASGIAPSELHSVTPLTPSAVPGAPAPVPVGAIALGAAGLAALAVGSVLEAIGLSDRQQLADTCGATRSCASSDVDAARARVLAGDIGLGAGAALSVAAAYVFFTRDTRARGKAGVMHLRIGPVRAGLAAGLEGSL
jgi:hypothetical protein